MGTLSSWTSFEDELCPNLSQHVGSGGFAPQPSCMTHYAWEQVLEVDFAHIANLLGSYTIYIIWGKDTLFSWATFSLSYF